MNTSAPIQLLQVFNGGKPCGWLGQTPTSYWFHYSSNNPQQHWVSLLMPPTSNFYQQSELFPVFGQHTDRLNQLHLLNGTQLGALSFANPDNPVVTPPLRTPPLLRAGQTALIANPGGFQVRRPFADTLVHHPSCWPMVQHLQLSKKQIDPSNRLHALRWTQHVQHTNDWVQHPRPDLQPHQHQLYGFEAIHSVLNINLTQFNTLAKNRSKFAQVLQEVVRTFCKNPSAEMALLALLLRHLQLGYLNAYLVYEQATTQTAKQQPRVLGLEYLPGTPLP
ncbi:hypothetical protein RGQ30_02870 [Limnobacter thiooxidans]|uniref:Uncharacterized protein n=1 Tax=Limnobacter thiooxidans TaxID=131080 RepID=A0AA86JDE5_9BURK|nr:hypothetical protein RGQ30_02870 [Limnobacter thiooxidans]